MEVRNRFELPASPDAVWALLLDVPRVIPCVPGAQLVETVGEAAWKVRLATTSLGFDANVVRASVDEATRTVVLAATARERAGRGAASARIVARLDDEDGRTIAHSATELTLSGPVARFGRQSRVHDAAAQMTDQLAANLRRELTGEAAANGAPAAAAPAGAAPSAVRLLAGILLRATIRRLQHWLARVEQTETGACA